ncbi:MAG: CopG family transcriptional regulator [Chloroflexi bacterium]|nr:CopG family transcriptional regulator [Chloroflexota bacterium]
MASQPEKKQLSAFGKQQFNIYLPPDLVRELKHAAIDDQSHMSGYVEMIFSKFLAERKKGLK